jgi:UrcA family protein
MKGMILITALAATSGCSTNFVRPVETDPLPSRVVTFNDLDLHNPADVGVLHDRIRRAAVHVCGGPINPHDFAQFWIRHCIQDAYTRAVADVDSQRTLNASLKDSQS